MKLTTDERGATRCPAGFPVSGNELICPYCGQGYYSRGNLCGRLTEAQKRKTQRRSVKAKRKGQLSLRL